MERSITEKEKEQIANCGAFGYSAARCAVILGWPEDEVFKIFMDETSEFFKAYAAGKYKSEYVIDLKLFEQAQAGDIKSLEKLETRKKRRK